MQTSILFKVPGKPSSSPHVILNGPALVAKFSTPAAVRIFRALSWAWEWTRYNCTPRNIVRAVFSPKVSMAVGTVVVLAMWWHNISIADAADASRAVGTDALAGMPWAIVWAFRASRRNPAEEGGAQ